MPIPVEDEVFLRVEIASRAPSAVAVALLSFGEKWFAKEIQITPSGEILHNNEETDYAVEFVVRESTNAQDSIDFNDRMVVVRVRS